MLITSWIQDNAVVNWIRDNIVWMRWTKPTTYLFIAVIVTLSIMTILDLIFPGVRRKGFLPFGFTRGDRLFLSVVIFLGTVLVWLAFYPEHDWHNAFPVAGVLILITVIWG